MKPKVLEEALRLVERAKSNGASGKIVKADDLAMLNTSMKNRIPTWYVELLTTIPLCGLEPDWQSGDDDGGEGSIAWADDKGIRSESLECYPGLAILERGYINVGSAPFDSGDSYFIPTDQGDNPPVYQVYHDIRDNADEILAEGLDLVSPSLSEFFRNALAGES